MVTPSPNFVSTDVGRLHVRRTGTGPPVVLWHSLFVDSRSWGPLIDTLARDRTVYAIDGPSHGKSEAVRRDFTFEECVAAADQALDRLGLTDPVDWVGNAWGGHVGIHLATAARPRLRTLTTIGTPVQGFTLGEKLTKGWPLVQTYRPGRADRLPQEAVIRFAARGGIRYGSAGSGSDDHRVVRRGRPQGHAARHALDDVASQRRRGPAAAHRRSHLGDVRARRRDGLAAR